jgi:hypothetical protein
MMNLHQINRLKSVSQHIFAQRWQIDQITHSSIFKKVVSL